MTKNRTLCGSACVLLLAVACSSTGEDSETAKLEAEVIYGEDDREDPFSYPDAAWAARSLEFTAALMSASQLDFTDPNDIGVGDTTFGERFGLCPDVRFASQLAVADCSATLIDDDIMLTAGHCINNCNDSYFVFDYAAGPDGTVPPITSDDVYRCVDFLAYTQSQTRLDYAVVRLERPVVGREPAAVRVSDAALPAGLPLIVSGFPSGLPLKIADNAGVRSTDANIELFLANLDTFKGNSGSGVFDDTTKELIGILVDGEVDFVPDGECNRPNQCPDDGCRGEDVVYAFHAIREMCEQTPSAVCSCGDGACGPLETPASCTSDCSCGDGICSTGETTSTCPADCRFQVLYDDHTPQPNWVTAGIQVRNTGADSIFVGGSTVRYYFTKEPPGTLSATCWGCTTTPVMTFHEVPGGGCSNATHYMDVRLPDMSLPASGSTERMKLAFHASSWQAFNPTNDYSYGSIDWDYAPNPRITMYRLGERVFGDEPCPGLFIPPPQ
jgi:hypothetical protein